MQGKRKDRVGHLVQMELGQLLLHRVKDPRLGFVTITGVDMPPDLKSALVFYSVMGDETKQRECQEVLERSSGFLQKEIAHNLKLRYTPKLEFRFDRGLDHGEEIESVLKQLDAERGESGGQEEAPEAS